nr:telomere length regulation protein [Melanopsichium pennsylvanicum 4]
MASSSSSTSSASASSTSASLSTQQTAPFSEIEPKLTPSAQPIQPPAAKPHPAFHPFFKQGGVASTIPTDTADESEADQKRPARSSRTKAPVSYREDLKAVLRADKAQEALRLKEEKRQVKLRASAAKKAQKASTKTNNEETSDNDKQEERAEDGFEVVDSRLATRTPAGKKIDKQATGSEATAVRSSSPKKPAPATKVIEQKPLSLAVKGTGSAAIANPHPFFVKKGGIPLPPPQAEAGFGSSESKAEISQPSDDKGKGSANPSASTSAFSAAPAAWSLFAAPRASSFKPKRPVHALWPTQQDTHVVALNDTEAELLSQARSGLDGFRSRWQPCALTSSKFDANSELPADFVTRMNRTRPAPSESGISLTGSDERFSSIDDYLATHVDISSLPKPIPSPSAHCSSQLWTDAFHPRTANACVGNETNALHLLEWLRRLLVAAPNAVRTADKKRKHGVVRRVDRKKRARRRRRRYCDDEDSDDMGDFIVDDDEDEDAIGEWGDTITDEEWFSKFPKIDRKTNVVTDDESLDVKCSQGTATATSAQTLPSAGTVVKTLAQNQTNRFASLGKLSNCIILTGPSGSGKTACVYACASELGYEVFELYPGMGKRSGKELLAAVGDLGRNHMVSSGGIGGGATFKNSSNLSAGTLSGVRQSLILIEEADVLFDEDKGFWPAVVELVAESKRPVVVVANELELVPLLDLPVQEVLKFEKPTLGAVVPLLQALAARNGRYLGSDQVTDMLLGLPGTEMVLDSEPDAEKAVGVDIRQALLQLEFGHLTKHAPKYEQGRDPVSTLASTNSDVKAVACAAESASLADVFETNLDARWDMEAFGEGGLEQQPNSRQLGGWTQLVAAHPLARHEQRQTFDSSASMEYGLALAEIHIWLATKVAFEDDEVPVTKMTEMRLRALQAREASLIQTLLHPLFRDFRFTQTSTQIAPSQIVSYAPFVRLMALVDEDLAQIHAALAQQAAADGDSSVLSAGGGRSTRNSSRLMSNWLSGETPGYERWLALGPEEVRAAKATSLNFR